MLMLKHNSYDLYVYKNPLKCSILGHIDKFSDPLTQSKAPYYQGIKFKGSNSPKSLYKLVLPEIVFIFNFYDVEVYKMFLKVVYRVSLTNFRTLLHTQMPFILPRKYINPTHHGGGGGQNVPSYFLNLNIFCCVILQKLKFSGF